MAQQYYKHHVYKMSYYDDGEVCVKRYVGSFPTNASAQQAAARYGEVSIKHKGMMPSAIVCSGQYLIFDLGDYNDQKPLLVENLTVALRAAEALNRKAKDRVAFAVMGSIIHTPFDDMPVARKMWFKGVDLDEIINILCVSDDIHSKHKDNEKDNEEVPRKIRKSLPKPKYGTTGSLRLEEKRSNKDSLRKETVRRKKRNDDNDFGYEDLGWDWDFD